MTAPWNKGKTLPPEPLTETDVRALIQSCSNRAPTGIRNRALLVVLYRAGLRCCESLQLKPKDLDTKHGVIRILHGKGDRSRSVGLDPEAWAVLQRWFDKRAELGINGRSRLFCTLSGTPLHSAYVRGLLKRLGKKASIEKRVHPHGLRHTHAFELANEGIPVHLIQKQLGHSSLATTATYLSHLSPQAVINAIQSRTWSVAEPPVKSP